MHHSAAAHVTVSPRGGRVDSAATAAADDGGRQMPRYEPTEVTGEGDGERFPKRRKAVRYAVPVAVAGAAAATIGLVPAFAGSGSPDLPKISAQDLIAKIAKSDVQQLSGTVRVTT